MAEATLNYQSIRTTHAAREAVRLFFEWIEKQLWFYIQDDLRIENRKKSLIILVLQWLAEEGYRKINKYSLKTRRVLFSFHSISVMLNQLDNLNMKRISMLVNTMSVIILISIQFFKNMSSSKIFVWNSKFYFDFLKLDHIFLLNSIDIQN